MSTSFILRCDGRSEYIGQSIASAQDNLKASFDQCYLVDDSGDDNYAHFLETSFPAFQVVHHQSRCGMNECARTMIKTAIASGSEFVFSTEDDFLFTTTVNVKKMARLLHCESRLGQLTLKRQPVNDVESLAGGFMEAFPERYVEHSCLTGNWTETSHVLFSGNPSLVRVAALAHAVDVEMPSTDTYEVPIGKAMADAGYVCAFYGKMGDKPRTEHLGTRRSVGYRW